jgi:hypothetical protein
MLINCYSDSRNCNNTTRNARQTDHAGGAVGSRDARNAKDTSEGEFHVDLYTLPDSLVKMIWDFVSWMRGVGVLHSSGGCTGTARNAKQTDHAGGAVRSGDARNAKDTSEGEFHVDLYTLPDSLVKMIWDFVSWTRNVEVLHSSDSCTSTTRNARQTDHAGGTVGSRDVKNVKDTSEGEFHIDLYTLPDSLVKMLWDFVSWTRNIEVLYSSDSCTSTTRNARQADHA